MNKTALLAAAAALAAATPAAATTAGYVGADYTKGMFDDVDQDGWRGEGAFGRNGGSWGVQVDGNVGNTDSDAGFDFDYWNADAHLYWQGGSWRVGGVAMLSSADLGGADFEETAYGVEAMVNTGPNSNLFASATFGDLDLAIVEGDTWNADIGFNLFAGPNARVGGTLGVGSIDFGGGIEGDTWSAGLNAELQPWSVPISLVFGYNHFEDDVDDAADMFSIGARWNFAGGTLQERDNATPFSSSTNLDRLFGLD